MHIQTPGVHDIGALTWGWLFDNQSGWSFNVGRPWLSVKDYDPPSEWWGLRTVRPQGDYGIHVLASRWRIHRENFPIVQWSDNDLTITRRFGWLNGIWLDRVEIAEGGWVRQLDFEAGVTVTLKRCDDESENGVANWFDYRDERVDS